MHIIPSDYIHKETKNYLTMNENGAHNQFRGKMIRIDDIEFDEDTYFEPIIDKINKLKKSNKNFLGNFDSFIEYLKEDYEISECFRCSNSTERKMLFLQELANCFELMNINIDELYKLIETNITIVLERVSEWKKTNIHLYNVTSGDLKIECNYAKYKYVNKWGQYKSEEPWVFEIYSYNKNVIWITKYVKSPEYFIFHKNKLYVIFYLYNSIEIISDIEKSFGKIIIDNDLMLDKIINNNKDTMNTYTEIRLKDIDYKKTEIDLTEHFHKNFFKKGPLYNQDWKFSLKPTSILTNIGFIDGLLKIEIENMTYPKPRHGYTLLDIDSMKLIKK